MRLSSQVFFRRFSLYNTMIIFYLVLWNYLLIIKMLSETKFPTLWLAYVCRCEENALNLLVSVYLHSLQNILFEVIFANLTFNQKFACNYSHTSEYSLHFASNFYLERFLFESLSGIALKRYHDKFISNQLRCSPNFKFWKPQATSLRPQLLFDSFWKYLLRFASKYSLWSEINKIFI
jgi:hypothetical protein